MATSVWVMARSLDNVATAKDEDSDSDRVTAEYALFEYGVVTDPNIIKSVIN